MKPWRWTTVLLLATGCAGELELRYGETLCDNLHPCAEGSVCEEGICIAGGSGDPAGDSVGLGDWDSGDVGLSGDLDYCRVDEQCGAGRVCANGVCMTDPCAGVDCGSQVCRSRCRPTDQSCDGVSCADGVEYCLLGGCVPMCVFDPCDTSGCLTSLPNCTGGACDTGYFCQNGVCEPTSVNACFPDNTCDAGFDCLVTCIDSDACTPNPCNSGWWCEDLGGGDYTCHEIACSGINCPPGERCQLGECVDPCEGKPCEEGGSSDSCPVDSICCGIVHNGRQCCEPNFLCRNNECVPPDCVNPDCEDDETCLPDGCYCGPVGEWEICDGDECCFTDQCVDPCVPNNCALEDPVEHQGCVANCDLPAGYECFDLCEGVVCTLPDTCDPATGECSCGGDICEGNECCISNTCVAPCATAPCPEAGAPDSRQCVVNCEQALGYECLDYCDGVDCSDDANTTCDHDDGRCKCGPGEDECVPSECCYVPPAGAQLECGDPCVDFSCGAEECTRSCTADPPRTCTDNCAPGACAGSDNPYCNPADGQCYCNDTFTAQCSGNQCCSDAHVCDDACQPNPCPTAAAPNSYECVRQCVASGDDFICQDYCQPGDCDDDAFTVCDHETGNCVCGVAEELCAAGECCDGVTCFDPCVTDPCPDPTWECVPDCASATAPRRQCINNCQPGDCVGTDNLHCNPGDGLCYCDDTTFSNRCGGVQCCDDATGQCENPCNPNPCLSNGDPTLQRCRRQCVETGDDYYCADWCAGETCAASDFHSVCDHDNGDCVCGPSEETCGANECCSAGGACVDPCIAANCGGLACVRDCTIAAGYTCEDLCTGDPCAAQDNSRCNPADGQCYCDAAFSVQCSGGSSCCDGSGCTDPCSPNPCSNPNPLCTPSCSASTDFSCGAACVPADCTDPRAPDCDPALGCRCGASPACTGDDCCISSVCSDPCAPNPCTTPPEQHCTRQCGTGVHYACDDACDPDPCTGNSQAPDCDPESGACLCDTGAACTGSQLCCLVGCQDPVPDTLNCASTPGCAYDPCIGCYDAGEGTCPHV